MQSHLVMWVREFRVDEKVEVSNAAQVGWLLPFGVDVILSAQSSAEVLQVVTDLE